MSAELGTELPPRGLFVSAGVLVAVGFAWPAFAAVRRTASVREPGEAIGAWALALAVVVLVVVVPLGAAWFFSRLHVFVSHDAVTGTFGDRVRTQLRFEDVSSVRIGTSGGVGVSTNTAVDVSGHDPSGKPVTVHVSRAFVTTLEPLLERLAQEARLRPTILGEADDRRAFERALAESR